jgi:hypothetical protein
VSRIRLLSHEVSAKYPDAYVDQERQGDRCRSNEKENVHVTLECSGSGAMYLVCTLKRGIVGMPPVSRERPLALRATPHVGYRAL